MFQIIDSKTALDFLLPRHYSGRKPKITYAFGYYDDLQLKAVCTFGKPASNHLCFGVAGPEYSQNVYELNRLCTDGSDLDINLSAFVGWCLRYLKQFNLILISYSDTQMNHHGYIYQATNWIYTGMTKPRTDLYVPGNKHSRHYKSEKQNGVRKFRSAKHRYVFFAGSKPSKKLYLSALKYDIVPYPKGENKHYVLGDYIKPIFIEK